MTLVALKAAFHGIPESSPSFTETSSSKSIPSTEVESIDGRQEREEKNVESMHHQYSCPLLLSGSLSQFFGGHEGMGFIEFYHS